MVRNAVYPRRTYTYHGVKPASKVSGTYNSAFLLSPFERVSVMEKSSVKKNFLYQMIYEVLVFILPFITSPYIARVRRIGDIFLCKFHSILFCLILDAGSEKLWQ